MRLLFLVQNYPPERGPVRYTSSLAAGLAARGHSVRVITGLPHYPEGKPHPDFGRWRPQVTREQGVDVVRTPLVMASNAQPRRRLLGMSTFPITAFPAALLGPRPDVVIASAPPLPICGLGLAVAALVQAPLVMLLRDVEPQITLDMRGLSHHRWAQAAMRLAGAMYERADGIVVVHESQVPPLTDFGVRAEKVTTIRHGIDLDAFDRLARLTGRRSLRRPGRALALYAGTLGVAHDVDAVVRLFAEPAIRALPVDFAVVGDGELRPRCERIVAEQRLENVHICPPAALDEVPHLLSSADLLISSYRTTGREIPGMIGSKLYEYFAAAKPVLVHGTGVAAELVRQVGNGWAIPPGDVSGLSRVLHDLLGSPASAAAMGERGRAHARLHFSQQERHDRWEALLRLHARRERVAA